MFWCLLLACLLQQATCDSNDVAGIEGKCVTFHLRYLKGEKLAWSSSRGTILTFQSGKSIDFFDSSLQSRVNVSENGSSLTICQLRSSDAGTYVANFNEFKEEFTLHVYSELRVPEVSCVCRNVSAENCSYVLRCSVEPPGDNSFFWSHHDQQVTKAPELVLEELPLEDPYTCTVQNPVSSRNTTVTPAALCAESTNRTDTNTSSHAGIIVPAVIGVLFLILFLVIIFLVIKSKGRRNRNLPAPAAPGAEAAADCMTVYAVVRASEQTHACEAQKNNAKKTPAAGVENSKTIYATVQAADQMGNGKVDRSTPGCLENEQSPYSTVSELGPWHSPSTAPACP